MVFMMPKSFEISCDKLFTLHNQIKTNFNCHEILEVSISPRYSAKNNFVYSFNTSRVSVVMRRRKADVFLTRH